MVYSYMNSDTKRRVGLIFSDFMGWKKCLSQLGKMLLVCMPLGTDAFREVAKSVSTHVYVNLLICVG